MSDSFVKKNLKLISQFHKYAWKHPELFEQIPNKSTLVVTIKGDGYFNRTNRKLSRTGSKPGEKIVEAHKEGSKWKILAN